MIIISQQQSNFVPDKYEERKLRKLRKLIAAGKITFEKKSKKAEPYLMWGDDGDVTVAGKKRGKAPAHIAAPKMVKCDFFVNRMTEYFTYTAPNDDFVLVAPRTRRIVQPAGRVPWEEEAAEGRRR